METLEGAGRGRLGAADLEQTRRSGCEWELLPGSAHQQGLCPCLLAWASALSWMGSFNRVAAPPVTPLSLSLSLITALPAEASLKFDQGCEHMFQQFWMQFGIIAKNQRIFAITLKYVSLPLPLST